MSFFEKGSGEGRFKKTEYLKLTQGTHTIRIIEPAGRRYNQHWMGGGVECVGEDCPQCKLNKQIIDDIGGDYQDAYKEAPDGGVLCGISLKLNGEWSTRWDGAENTNIEGVEQQSAKLEALKLFMRNK